MHVHRIDHVSLNVRDRTAALAWYEQVLGLRPHRESTPPDWPLFLGPDTAQLALFEEGTPGLRHVALAVATADHAELRDRLGRLQIPFNAEIHGAHESFYFKDPEGNTIEVFGI